MKQSIASDGAPESRTRFAKIDRSLAARREREIATIVRGHGRLAEDLAAALTKPGRGCRNLRAVVVRVHAELALSAAAREVSS